MLQIRFIKEGINHFLVTDWDGEWVEKYEGNLLRYQEIPHFMSYEVRSIDGETALYYKMGYRTSLETLVNRLPLNLNMVKNMVSNISNVVKLCQEYLLSPENIVFEPDKIFVDLETGRYMFLYYPGFIGERHYPKDLIAQMLQYVDRKDEKCMIYLMRYYDKLTEQDFCIDDTYAAINNITLEKAENEISIKSYDNYPEEAPVKTKDVSNNNKENVDPKRRIDGFVKILMMITAVFDITLLAGLIFDVLTYEKMGYLFVGMAVLIGLTILHMIFEDEETPEMIMEEYNSREKTDNIEMNYDKEINYNKEMNINKENDFNKEIKYSNDIYFNKEEGINAINETHETVLLMADEDDTLEVVSESFKGELYLEAMIKDMFLPIYIKGGNVVVGSLEACDYVLTARGVSRFHAKLLKKEDGLYLLDLNSTNGTYLNGDQLEAGREYRLEAGDMVSFAGNGFFVAEDTAYISGRKAG